MAALDFLNRVGLTAEISGKHLRLRPRKRITDNVRQFVRQNRETLMAEVRAEHYPPTPDVIRWLSNVAKHLRCKPGYLLEQGFIDRYDLRELHRIHPRRIAALILTNPSWPATGKEKDTVES